MNSTHVERITFLKRGAVSVGTLSIVSGCLGAGSPDEATFEVDYFGDWSGALGGTGSMSSISGSGSRSYTINDPGIVSGNAQKRDGGTGTLTVSISANGEVVAESSTSSQFGVAQVSHSF
jgi:hypothetical protein